MWRTMFSISTMASSTRMPVTSVMPSRLTRLSEKPSSSIAQKVGIAESGRAIAAISVARQLRRNRKHDERRRAPRPRSASPSPSCSCRGCRRRRRRSASSATSGIALVAAPRCAASTTSGDRQLARALGAEDREGDDRAAVEAREGCAARWRRRSTRPSSSRRTLRPPAATIVVSARSSTVLRAGERADRLLLAADLAAAAGRDRHWWRGAGG